MLGALSLYTGSPDQDPFSISLYVSRAWPCQNLWAIEMLKESTQQLDLVRSAEQVSIGQSSGSLLERVPLNMVEIAPDRLNIDTKERSNLLPWNGQFSPQFIEALLEKYASKGCRVLDPFCGSGTVLYECGRFNLEATGIEVNPAAYLLSRTYVFCNVPQGRRASVLRALDSRLASIVDSGILSNETGDRDAIIISGDQLMASTEGLDDLERSLLETFVILADLYRGGSTTKLEKVWQRLRRTVEALPYSKAPIRALIGDGRFPDMNGTIDLVVTSPPYINVYNYHQQYRASAEALGWDLLRVAKTEIGSNRKNRGNRFLTVVQYCLDISMVLVNLWAATTPTARLIFVLGRESKVRGVSFLNGELFARLAVDAVGYVISLRQERVFTNRFGQRIFEDIIHLEKGTLRRSVDVDARTIAADCMRVSLAQALEDDVRQDLELALASVNNVQPSPPFDAANSHKDGKLRPTYDLSNPAL